MYSIDEIVTVAHRKQVQNRQKRAGLLVVFGGSALVWAAIFAIAIQLS